MLREQPTRLIQRRDDHVHDSIVQTGDSIFMPAGQPSYWDCQEKSTCESILHIYLKPELITQVAETSNLNGDRIDLVNCFSKPDRHLQQIAMLLLAELKSGELIGQLYVESLTQVLAIHQSEIEADSTDFWATFVWLFLVFWATRDLRLAASPWSKKV